MLGGVHIGLGEEDRALVGGDFKEREGVFPEELHVVPVLDDSMGERILELIQSSFVAGEFFADVIF